MAHFRGWRCVSEYSYGFPRQLLSSHSRNLRIIGTISTSQCRHLISRKLSVPLDANDLQVTSSDDVIRIRSTVCPISEDEGKST
jgi:hypothetical protein